MKLPEYRNMYEHEERHFIYVGMHTTILTLLKRYTPHFPLRILDAGCGTGLLMKKLEGFGNVEGIDISLEAIKFCKKRGLIKVKTASVTNLPYRKNTFDLVVSIDVLYHQKVDDDHAALEECNRVLKHNGILLLKLPAYNWLQGKHDIIEQTKHRYITQEVSEKLKKANFRILKLTYGQLVLLPFVALMRIIGNFLPTPPRSDVVKLPHLLNTFLIQLLNRETDIVMHTTLPAGLTIFAVAKKG